MDKDKKDLLKSINSGCKNATNSIEQALEFVKDKDFADLLCEYNREHVKLGDESHRMLEDSGCREEDPSAMAKAMMWFTTEIKMMTDSTDSHVAELMMDGCHMGIKTITRDCRRYSKAGHDVLSMAGRLVNLEQDFYLKMLGFI